MSVDAARVCGATIADVAVVVPFRKREYSRFFESCSRSLLQIDERLKGLYGSVRPILARISDTRAVETAVVHPKLHYAGTVDCVARFEVN